MIGQVGFVLSGFTTGLLWAQFTGCQAGSRRSSLADRKRVGQCPLIVVERSETTLYVFPSFATCVSDACSAIQQRKMSSTTHTKKGKVAHARKYRGGRRAQRGDHLCTDKKVDVHTTEEK